MICIDNSEWMRNGVYSPSLLRAQAGAVSLICGAKTQSNPENTVGILTMGGKELEMGGEMNIAAGILVAQLALKHCQNKNQRQRIIVFAGSPVQYYLKVMEMIGKKLKKKNVALDIVNSGEDDEETPEKLEALLTARSIVTSADEGGTGFTAAAPAVAAGGVSDFELV